MIETGDWRNREPQIGRPRRLDVGLLDRLVCPTCALPLVRCDIGDAFTIGLQCSRNHRFLVEMVDAESSDMTKILNPPQGDWSVLLDWCRVPRLRNCMSGRLATILRRIAEIKLQDRHISDMADEKVYRYCPCCGKLFVPSAEDTDWGPGLKCENAHRYERRSGLTFRHTFDHVQLERDLSDDLVAYHARGYATDEEIHWQIDPSVKRLLTKFYKGFQKKH